MVVVAFYVRACLRLSHTFRYLRPSPGNAVADIVHLTGNPALQRNKADSGEIFDMNQIDILSRRVDPTLLDPVERMSVGPILAPLFEELVFRGLLFAILRRKFRFLPAALISASIFGLAHGYGAVGLISVCWSGVLWAWIYEKTGSLAPGILAHAINNLLVCLAVMPFNGSPHASMVLIDVS